MNKIEFSKNAILVAYNNKCCFFELPDKSIIIHYFNQSDHKEVLFDIKELLENKSLEVKKIVWEA